MTTLIDREHKRLYQRGPVSKDEQAALDCAAKWQRWIDNPYSVTPPNASADAGMMLEAKAVAEGREPPMGYDTGIARAKYHLRKIAAERKADPMPHGDMVAAIYWQRREDERKQRAQKWAAYIP